MKKINFYRKQIDEIDKKIITLLGKRFLIVKRIGEEKKKLNLSSLDKKRFQYILKTRKEWAKQHQLSPFLIKKIFQLIHNKSLVIEK